ncbi:hypothetical protein RRG08_035699 [Elysia crispata]|uniref:Uncharacterized protein n=1 Tax=Elysia crispata TaxID=231223 RepID=A0AAE0YIF5_9GAST|nr:hypothetical protein RRG08_035699 [Elysia crispata]
MGARNRDNLKAGFRTCGIFPVNADAVLKKFPHRDNDKTTDTSIGIPLSEAVLDYLHKFKFSPTPKPQRRQKRTRLTVAPGKSVSAEDLRQQRCAETECSFWEHQYTSSWTRAVLWVVDWQ